MTLRKVEMLAPSTSFKRFSSFVNEHRAAIYISATVFGTVLAASLAVNTEITHLRCQLQKERELRAVELKTRNSKVDLERKLRFNELETAESKCNARIMQTVLNLTFYGEHKNVRKAIEEGTFKLEDLEPKKQT